ncbi:3-hydroxybutyryl-CoA dehydrogenase [Iodidimonas gelatinilytica]|uniref:3-hydroxybutyryl-CoA dehydrogenase n=1 Tax=Iodidimonas gelatinilytica TaxID=1236966 RepID=A0A5A7MUB1_9PROT|nr:3-hydroxybutyryl-CoA dehydrogenase [Iodidimonas gelatinilytica]GEQ99487.1 3-hydroxybutyryl-CoA dehydrogenase [Iodidimonas gelatinilytica]
MRKVGVIGAGQMGNGIAHVIALGGHDVILADISKERAVEALGIIHHNMERQVNRGLTTQSAMDEAMGRIIATDKLSDMRDADLAIEAATEKENVKVTIFKELCETLKPEALLATNTSSISITRLAASTDRPEKFIGMHFMNPVPVMKLVEVIRGIATSEETYKTAREFVSDLGKEVAIAEDFPAFIVNRILLPMINEAIYTLYEGVGSVEAIDKAMRLGANHPMGPLQLADFIGLDTCLSIMQVLYEAWPIPNIAPAPCW